MSSISIGPQDALQNEYFPGLLLSHPLGQFSFCLWPSYQNDKVQKHHRTQSLNASK